jgi:DNA-binding LacI/PurR family transcriptional regulator
MKPSAQLSPSQPLYRQVEAYLRAQIDGGTLRPGDMLPSVRQLCEQFGGINHLTVRQALKQLAEERLVRSVQGRGTFVAERRLRMRRIALVLPNLEDTLFTRIARGVQSVLETESVKTIILDSRGDWNNEVDNIHQLEHLPIGGSIIFPLAHGDIAEQMYKFKTHGFPFVLVDRYFEDIETPSVVVDNYQGSYDLASYLVGRGHRRIVWIGELGSTAARARQEGFRDALNDAGIACPRTAARSIEVGPASPAAPYKTALEGGVAARIAELLAEVPRPDAIMCANDLAALFALQALTKKGVAVPGDIAVAGFDDVPEAAIAHPPLTTVRQPMQQMGEEAAHMLLDQMENPETRPQRKVLPVELVVRASA